MNKWATDWASEEETRWVSVYGCRLRFVWGCWFICLNVQSLQTKKTASHWFLKPAQPCRSYQDEQNNKNNDNVNKHFLICTVETYYGLWDKPRVCGQNVFYSCTSLGIRQCHVARVVHPVPHTCQCNVCTVNNKSLCSTGTAPCPSLSHTPVGAMRAQWITCHCVALVVRPVPACLTHLSVQCVHNE